jgi:phage host-nuclease inhibitor protein Gam
MGTVRVFTALNDIKEAATNANDLLRQIGDTRRERLRKQAELDAGVQKLKDELGPAIDTLKQQEESFIDQLVKMVLPRFGQLVRAGTKTIYLRSGEISMKASSKETLEIAEGVSEDLIINRIARRSGLRKFTRLGKRTLNKEALKKDPAFVAKIKDLSIVRKNSLVIKPASSQGEEIVRDTTPLSVPLPPQQD